MIDRRYGKRLMQAFDYSDGVELVETMFAIRFEGVEMANEFKKEFERCQKESKKLYESADAAEAFVCVLQPQHSTLPHTANQQPQTTSTSSTARLSSMNDDFTLSSSTPPVSAPSQSRRAVPLTKAPM